MSQVPEYYTEMPEGDGWEDGGQRDIHGWWRPEEGLTFQGKIVGQTSIDDQDICLVELQKPARAVTGKGEDCKEVVLEPGNVLGVRISHALQDMLLYVETQAEVWAAVTGQRDVGRPKPMWLYRLRFRGQKSKSPAQSREAAEPDITPPF